MSVVRVRLRPAAERAVRQGHPWVYAESIREEHRRGDAGDVAVIYDRNDKFLGAGLYDPFSPLRIRVAQLGKPASIDAAFWRERVRLASASRAPLTSSGYRLVNGESDGLPGLVIDRYAEVMVMKLYSAAWLPYFESIARELNGEAVVLRLARNVEQEFADRGYRDGQVIAGELDDAQVVFEENGIRFRSDVKRGQKTGFFLDQRENRKRVGELSKGRSVLNCFSFSGGFSLYAAKGGAKDVADLDISKHALEAATENFRLNPDVECPREMIQANAFDWLDETGASYDLIVLDPPSLAKKEADRENALRGYRRLVSAAIKRLRRRGILVSASCSAHVGAEEFFALNHEVVLSSGRGFDELERTRHAVDHPATFPEAEYLKCIYLGFDG
ncbi:MAG: class I SAM-dependent methyltransferase [Limisphaerales bacterium]